jgi:signal transduction histidine kinase
MRDWARRHLTNLCFALALALLAGAFGLSLLGTRTVVADAGWRQHTYEVIAELRGLLNALIDAETGQRGYLLTGDQASLDTYHQGAAETSRRLATLRRLTADNPLQQRRLSAYAVAAAGELASLGQGIAGRPERAASGASGGGLAALRDERRLMAGLRGRLAEMEAEERLLLVRRDRAMVAAVQRTNLSLLAGAAVAMLLLAAAFVALRREIGQRRQAEQAMRQANRRLAAANGELEAFCYSVSHDLRAPLRAIDGFSQALAEDAGERLAPAEHESLARVRAAARRMAGLIDDLLRLSRISRIALAPRDVDLSALAHGVVAELREREPQRRAAVEIEAGVHAVGDERLLRIVLVNLLGNAWKFTRNLPQAHIAFRLDLGAGEPAYAVSDDGAGFDMAYADQLFGAFQRLHSEREFEGSGIGLATVARVVRLHGGRVWAESQVGRGATFRFTLDAAAGAARGPGAAAVEATR